MLGTVIEKISDVMLAIHSYIQEDVNVFFEYCLLVYNSEIYQKIELGVKSLYHRSLQMIIESYHTKSAFPLKGRTLCYVSTSKPKILLGALDHLNTGTVSPVKMVLTHHKVHTHCLPTLDQLQQGYGINLCKKQ